MIERHADRCTTSSFNTPQPSGVDLPASSNCRTRFRRSRIASAIVNRAIDLDGGAGAGEGRSIELVMGKTRMDSRLYIGEADPSAQVQDQPGAPEAAMAAHVHIGELLERTVLTANNDDLVEGVEVIDARVVVAVAMVLTTALQELFFGDAPGHRRNMPDRTGKVKAMYCGSLLVLTQRQGWHAAPGARRRSLAGPLAGTAGRSVQGNGQRAPGARSRHDGPEVG